MALGDMLTGSSGAAFAKGLSVAVPKDRAFYEGVRASQQQAAARARAGVSADNQLLKIKLDAAKNLNVDKKLVPEAQELVTGFMQGIDQAVVQYGDAQRALPHLSSSLLEFKKKAMDIEAADALVKAARKAAAQPNALVVEPVTSWLGNDSQKMVQDDGFSSLPGFNVFSQMSSVNPTGAVVLDFPKKIDISKLDEEYFNDVDISYFMDPNNAEVKTSEFKIEGTTFQRAEYTVKRDAIRKRVAASYELDPDYQSNVAFAYYNANRKNPGFKDNVRELEQKGFLKDALIDFRTDQLYAQGIKRSERLQGREPFRSTTNVTVNTGETPEAAVLGTPSMQISNVETVQQDRSKKTMAYPAIALNYGEDNIKLGATEGIIDLRTNEPTQIIGTFSAKSSKIELVPVFAENVSPGGNQVRIAGKLIPQGEVAEAIRRGNFTFDVFAKVVADEVAKPGNKKEKDAQLLFPASAFFNQNVSLGTRAQISKSEQNKKQFAELMAVRDLLNSKNDTRHNEALDIYIQYLSTPTDNDKFAKLTQIANEQGYVSRYMRNGKYVALEELNQVSTGVAPIEKSKDVKKTTPKPSSGAGKTPPKGTEPKTPTPSSGVGKTPPKGTEPKPPKPGEGSRRQRTNQTL